MKLKNKKEISSYIYVLMMIVIFLLSSNLKGQNFLKQEISVVEFNTSWNESNFIQGLNNLKNCNPYTIILCDYIDYMDKFNIKQPTIIIFNNGDEIKRFESTIMLDFDINYKGLQKEVDKLLLNKFN